MNSLPRRTSRNQTGAFPEKKSSRIVVAPGLGRDCRNSVLSALSSMKALRESAFSVSRIITPAFEYFRKSSRLASLTRMSTSPVIC